MEKTQVKKVSKKERLKKTKVVDGQTEEEEKKNLPIDTATAVGQTRVYRSIDELFNFKGAMYKTFDETEYHTSLGSLNSVDLQNEAWRVGLLPHQNRNVMIERLLKQFRRVTGSLLNNQKAVVIKFDKQALDILSEGKNRPQ